MKQYGLIGEKLGHSLSVPIHEAIWEKISLAASYRLIEIPRGELAAVVPELLRTLDGFNITVPYKTDVMPLLDEITPFAREVGAVNTVLTGKTSRGYNTDDPGFEQMLRYFDMNPDGARCSSSVQAGRCAPAGMPWSAWGRAKRGSSPEARSTRMKSATTISMRASPIWAG